MVIQYEDVLRVYREGQKAFGQRAQAAIGFATTFMDGLAKQMSFPAERITFLDEEGKPADLSLAMWFQDGWWRWRWLMRFADQGPGFAIRGTFSISNERGQWDFSTEEKPTFEQYDADILDKAERNEVIGTISQALRDTAERSANPRPTPPREGEHEDWPRIGFHVSRE